MTGPVWGPTLLADALTRFQVSGPTQRNRASYQ